MTVRMLFAIAAHIGVKVMQVVLPNAYPNADITNDVYVVQPRGLEDPEHRHKVCKLSKPLYGMKMSGRCSYNALSSCLTSQLGCQRSKIDHCIFFRPYPKGTSIMAICVDSIMYLNTGGEKQALEN